MARALEQVTGWLLRSAATATLLGGLGMLAATLAAFGMFSESDVPSSIGTTVLQLGAAFAVGGVAAQYLSCGVVLPNERLPATDDRRAGLTGWLVAFALTLVAAPAWLVLQLLPFLSEWRRVVDLVTTAGLWDTANANMSAVILLPLAGALAPPFIELLTMAAFIGFSVLLLPLLLLRSPRLPRFYLLCIVLLAAGVFGSWRGAQAAMLAGNALRELATTTSVNAEEAATVTGALDRYTSVVAMTVPPLAWTLLVYLVWAVPLLRSSRAHRSFALRADPAAAGTSHVVGVDAITRPPRFPGMTL